MKRRIYLASPYSSDDPDVRRFRYLAACNAAALIMNQGDLVFSPIAHSQPLAECHGLRGDFDFWRNWCLSFLRNWATHFTILDIVDGWDTSKGVVEESRVADELGIPFIPWSDFLENGDE